MSHQIIARLAAIALLFLASASQVAAFGLLRDPDIEHGLDQIAAPVLRAAGLDPGRVRIMVVDDGSLNAFVADMQSIFIHRGLLAQLDSAAQLQAVIAHEAAHIANGHIGRRVINMRSARSAAGIGLILSAAAAIASNNGAASAGLAAGSQSAALRNFLSHTRAEEASADQSSIRYLARAGIPTSAAAEVLDLFVGQEVLSVGRQDPYARSHPLSRERQRALQAAAAAFPGGSDDPTAQYWFARLQGKLSAFTQGPAWTLRRVRGETGTIAAMRAAIAYHRTPDPSRAIAQIEALSAAAPTDPFLHELRGQILLENRQFPRAVNAYARAVELAPGHALILGGYGRALLQLGTADAAARARDVLERARIGDQRDARVLRDLAQAYGRSGQNGMASLVTAERYALTGRLRDAALHATRASGLLPQGSGPWSRAQDLLRTADTLGR